MNAGGNDDEHLYAAALRTAAIRALVAEIIVVRVRCHAQVPDSARASSEDGRCNNVLGDVLGPLKFVGLRARRPEIPGNQVWLQCGRIDCRTWNVFEPITRSDSGSPDGGRDG